ncbi:MAG: 4Fe-4S dicluster domain-containing protein [Ignavibacteria bacterium]|nr:4Fe-4S dicluster domain-containing protein [Ignavibacteria bacterium]
MPSSLQIGNECISCGACLPECPTNAIYENGSNWSMGGKNYGENDAAPSGASGFYSIEHYYIVPDKCTECYGYYDEPQCKAVCPVDCIVIDPNHVESKEDLVKKKNNL